MPNGGSDCCGTCWFNAKNKGEAGHGHARDPELSFCRIRGLAIDHPFYTYCANHPHRRPERDPVPIGPVFIGDSSGARRVWQDSPDTENIRLHLFRLVSGVGERTASEYPIGPRGDEVVVWQLGEFRERRAVPHLDRIARIDGPIGEVAREALAKIAAEPKERRFEYRVSSNISSESLIRRALERAFPEMAWEEGDSAWDKIRVSARNRQFAIRVYRYEEPGPFELTITLYGQPNGDKAELMQARVRDKVLIALNARLC